MFLGIYQLEKYMFKPHFYITIVSLFIQAGIQNATDWVACKQQKLLTVLDAASSRSLYHHAHVLLKPTS